MASIIDIEGIGSSYAKKLQAAGIHTTEGLLAEGATPKGRKALAVKTGIGDAYILKWVNRADLFRINGVGEQYSDLLEAAGVDTVVELSKRKPENLQPKLAETNKKKRLVRAVPGLDKLGDWVAQAKQLPRAVKY